MSPAPTNSVSVISAVVAHALPRPSPSDPVTVKSQYAVRFADCFGRLIARDLSTKFPGIEASPRRSAASVRGAKQLDVNYSTPQLGLGLGISLKSVHIREATGSQRYTHNLKRNEEELRVEASGYHKRQPYAVMVGVMCLPFDSCTDARGPRNPSSFGSWVRHLRPFTGRASPLEEDDRFERLYVALYQPDGTDLRFFDLRTAPPRNGIPPDQGPMFGPQGPDGPPRRLLTYDEFLAEVERCFLQRNHAEFTWSDSVDTAADDDPTEAPDDEE